MKSVNALRTVLSGLIVGVTNFVLSALLLSAFAPSFLNFVERAGAHARWRGEVFVAIDVAAGVWAMWLYSVVRSKYPSPSRAATVTGLAWWAIKSLQSSKMVGLGALWPRW